LQAALNVELRAAVKAGDLEEVKKLLKEGADVTTPMPDHVIPDDDVQVTLRLNSCGLPLPDRIAIFQIFIAFFYWQGSLTEFSTHLAGKYPLHGLATSSLGGGS
jgi:hypothetical protein